MEKIYDFRPIDPYDAETRLQMMLSDYIEPLTEFSICFWFFMTRFKPFNSLLSYALSDQDDNAFRIVPSSSSVYGMFKGNEFRIPHQMDPLRWYHTCYIVNETSFTISVGQSLRTYNGHFKPLPLNGSLVIGQEQDSLNGGYTPQQSFSGKFTSMNIWPVALEAGDLELLQSCSNIKKRKLIEWKNMHWNIYNDSGTIFTREGNPCFDNEKLKYLFFNNKENWLSALRFTRKYQLQMVVPGNGQELKNLSDLIRFHTNCTSEFTAGLFAWVGIQYIHTKGEFKDTQGKDLQYDSWYRHLTRAEVLGYLKGLSGSAYVMQDSGGGWHVDDNDAQLCFVAVRQSQDKVLFIHNLKSFINVIYDYDSMFIMAPSSGDGRSVYFHGLGNYFIRKDSSLKWCLFKYFSSDEEALLCIQSDVPPLGRSDWIRQDNKTIAQLAFSSCSADQYTCPDGTCLSLKSRCDQQIDCKTGADEMNCFTTTLPHGYVRQLPSDVPLKTVITIDVWRIGNVDIINMAMCIDLIIHIQWSDSRLQFRHLHVNKSRMITKDNEMIWSPEARVLNSVAEARSSTKDIFVLKKTEMKGESGEYLSATGSLIQSESLQTTFHCPFNLTKYPLDDQLCNLNFQITNLGKSGLIFSPESRVLNCPSTLSQYTVDRCDVTMRNGTSYFNVLIALRRRPDYMLWTTYLPTLLLLGIGFGTLFLPVDSFAERGGMSLTTLLVLISLYSETSSTLPKTAYLKLIDVWFVFCISYLSLVIGVHLFTSDVRPTQKAPLEFSKMRINVSPTAFIVLTPRRKSPKCGRISNEKLLKWSRIVCSLVFVIFMLLYFNSGYFIA